MQDLTVIILTKNERLHIARCLERLAPLEPRRVLVVDCNSTDGTQEIAREHGAEVVEHDWPGLYAVQFNWALENTKITTEWVLRLDADEYLTDKAIAEIREKLPVSAPDISAFSLPLARTWMKRPVYHGVGTVYLTRIFRFGKAQIESRFMDEHVAILEGMVSPLKHPFVDDNLNDLDWWTKKHLNYALREALDLLRMEYAPADAGDARLNASASAKRAKKSKYAKLPLFWRSFAYFLYRYILRGGFRDGWAGFTWNFFQGWWYRTMVDARIVEIKRATGAGQDREHAWERIRAYARERGLRI